MARPIIGITCSQIEVGERKQPWLAAHTAYADAVAAGGGVPLLLPIPSPDWPNDPEAYAQAMLERVDGLLLSGGNDSDPSFYGQELHPATKLVSRERDLLELALAKQAMQHDRPMLGICRGIQTLTIAAGGSLIQDLPIEPICHSSRPERSSPYHKVTLDQGSRLNEIYGVAELTTNSYHHQAADAIGSLRIIARADDGVVEGLEKGGCRFVLGVQWHPEEMIRQYPEQVKLFQALVGAARR